MEQKVFVDVSIFSKSVYYRFVVFIHTVLGGCITTDFIREVFPVYRVNPPCKPPSQHEIIVAHKSLNMGSKGKVVKAKYWGIIVGLSAFSVLTLLNLHVQLASDVPRELLLKGTDVIRQTQAQSTSDFFAESQQKPYGLEVPRELWLEETNGTRGQTQTPQLPASDIIVESQRKRYASEVCEQIASLSSSSDSMPSPGDLWITHLDKVLEASRNVQDEAFTLRNITLSLLLDLPPKILQRGLKSKPRAADVARIVEIVQARRRDPDLQRPLTILVLGGSVTEGVGCNKDFDGQSIAKEIMGHDCAWPARLETLINTLLGFDAIRVVNAASGGTHTGQAVSIVKYWLYPEAVMPQGPDIIINAYGTNDNHIGSYTAATAEADVIAIIRETAYENLNTFVKSVREQHGCPPPIVFHLDEYVAGHGQGSILRELVYNSVITQVANWYQNFAVSSADIVRMFTYADPSETTFSAQWKEGTQGRDPHFPWTGHMTIAWAFAYNFLQVLVDDCHDTANTERLNQLTMPKDFQRIRKVTQKQKDLVENLPPPPLDGRIDIDSVSSKWEDQAKRETERCERLDSNATSGSPCAMAFVTDTVGPTSIVSGLRNYLRPFVSNKRNWSVKHDESHGWARKLGFEAGKPNATVDFVVREVPKSIRVITINALKSYGTKWEGSKASFTVFDLAQPEEPLKKIEISGTHGSTSSISYTTTMDLQDKAIPPGGAMKLEIRLVGGSAFKITGLMFCES